MNFGINYEVMLVTKGRFHGVSNEIFHFSNQLFRLEYQISNFQSVYAEVKDHTCWKLSVRIKHRHRKRAVSAFRLHRVFRIKRLVEERANLEFFVIDSLGQLSKILLNLNLETFLLCLKYLFGVNFFYSYLMEAFIALKLVAFIKFSQKLDVCIDVFLCSKFFDHRIVINIKFIHFLSQLFDSGLDTLNNMADLFIIICKLNRIFISYTVLGTGLCKWLCFPIL